VLLIVDIRFPALHFSPTLYKHCLENDKDLILVLNKIDLVPTAQVVAWKTYFEEKFPKLHVLLFSSSKQIKFRRAKHQAKLGKNKQAVSL
jgi:ribosome biogenesis GTPase A